MLSIPNNCMDFRHSFLFLTFLSVIVLAAASPLHADEKPTVDVAEAKAELEKAKRQKAKEQEEASSEKAPRRRIFPLLKRKDEKPEKVTEPKSVTPGEETKEETEASKKAASEEPPAEVPQPQADEAQSEETKPRVRPRLFRRNREKSEDQPIEADNSDSVVADNAETAETESKSRKRFSLFNSFRRDEKEQPTEAADSGEADQPELEPTELAAEVTSEPEEKPEATEPRSRKRLFSWRSNRESTPAPEESNENTEEEASAAANVAEKADEPAVEEKQERKRLFSWRSKRDSPPALEEAEETKEEETSVATNVAEKTDQPAVEDATPEKKSGGSLFGIFRRGDSKGLEKAEKTKLGKSIENVPDSKSEAGGILAKKKSGSTGALGWYVITEEEVPFYAIGPGQPLPPEKMLDRGSMLTVTKGGWGWCNVKLSSGELGVVSSKAMRPATVAEISRNQGSGSTASRSRGSRRLFNILSRGPAPKPALPTSDDSAPIRNFGLLPSIDSTE